MPSTPSVCRGSIPGAIFGAIFIQFIPNVADELSKKLGKPVRLIKDWVDGGFDVAPGELVLLENVRFNKGEKKNVDETAQKYAKLCDVFVMDAFGTAHRAEATTHGMARFAPVACAGPLLAAEIDAGRELGLRFHPCRGSMDLGAAAGGGKVQVSVNGGVQPRWRRDGSAFGHDQSFWGVNRRGFSSANWVCCCRPTSQGEG